MWQAQSNRRPTRSHSHGAQRSARDSGSTEKSRADWVDPFLFVISIAGARECCPASPNRVSQRAVRLRASTRSAAANAGGEDTAHHEPAHSAIGAYREGGPRSQGGAVASDLIFTEQTFAAA